VQYRKFGSLDFQVSALGFGAMRLPVIDNKPSQIDEKETARMIHYAIDQGVNYVDTAYPYHEGLSETVVGKVLKQDGYRNKVKLADKLPCWLINEQSDCDKILDEQLAKLQTDYIDFYLLHALFSERWQSMKNHRVLEWAEKVKKQGKIGHIGFSFHDSFGMFKEIVDSYDKWEFCQIQFNYMNENVQAGQSGLEYAANKGLGIVIMEPLLGGTLVNHPPMVQKYFADQSADPVDIALRWLWDKPEVSVVLSGMSSMEQTKHNVESAKHSGIGRFTMSEKELVEKTTAFYKAKNAIPCTKCKYCMPCPNNVDIPYNFELYNQGVIFDNFDACKGLYNYHIPEINKASACIQCKACEKKCPQHIKISEWMPKVHKDLVF
jgi:predicted aldo/keto reductase-like oxidoreductase